MRQKKGTWAWVLAFLVKFFSPHSHGLHRPHQTLSWTWTLRFFASFTFQSPSSSSTVQVPRVLQPWELRGGSWRLCSGRTGFSKFATLTLLLLRFFIFLFHSSNFFPFSTLSSLCTFHYSLFSFTSFLSADRLHSWPIRCRYSFSMIFTLFVSFFLTYFFQLLLFLAFILI